MRPPGIEHNTSVPPVNLLTERTHSCLVLRGARDITPYFALTPSRALRVRSYFDRLPPGLPAARRRPTVTNIDTAIPVRSIPAPSESCKHAKTTATQDRSGPTTRRAPLSPRHSLPSRPLSRANTTVQDDVSRLVSCHANTTQPRYDCCDVFVMCGPRFVSAT